ncbi:MAG: hypothetical protein ACLQBJ_10425 [Bryobacteraceae bacterium]
MRTGLLIAALGLSLAAQTTPAGEPQTESKGLPPRAAPADYQAHAQVGTVTLAAEFARHTVPTMERPFNDEDYVAVEVGLFGPAGARARISADDFSLRVNGKKTPLPSRQFELVRSSLKDPEWQPPDEGEKKSKGGISTGGSGNGDPPPTPAHMPFEMQRAMELLVKKAALPEGDRALPQAGVLFFNYRGKTTAIRSLELIYEGPVGKASLTLQP